MALDRQSVEKKDFPIARRGYEPEAVDAHLARLAGEIEALQRQQSGGRSAASSASLAIAASEQVRAIVEAAESSAADIESAARDEAERIRGEARADAERTRDDAVARSKEHVGQVGDATSLMLQRVDAMEKELGALLESLRTGTNRLTADLSLLQGNMGDLYGAAGAEPQPAPAAAAPPAPEPAAAPEPPSAGAPSEEPGPFEATTPAEAAPVEEPAPAAAPAAAAESASGDDADVEGARLIALNMALNGQSREETGQYLADNFDLADRDALLDEVYATVEG